MLLVCFAWVIILLVFVACGNMLIDFWNKLSNRNDKYSLFDIFWIGLCTVGTILITLSLLLPINIAILFAFLCLTLIYWIINKQKLKEIVQTVKQGFFSFSTFTKILLALAFCAILARTTQSPIVADYGLYHQQSLMWIEQYSVVPGLGNLHGRLAFNSSFFLLTTLFSYHPHYYTIFYPLTGLCFLVLSVWIINKLNTATAAITILSLFYLFYFTFTSFGGFLSSTSTDILQGLIIIYILFSCILEEKSLEKRTLALIFIPIFCITLKLSSAPILIITIILFILSLKNKQYNNLWLTIGLGCIVLGPWCLRFIIQTGYLIYPFPAIDIFSFDWKVPIELVINEKSYAYSWARIPHVDAQKVLAMPLKEWVLIWAERIGWETLRMYIIALVSPLLLLGGYRFLKKNKILLLVWGIAFIGSAFGFFTAPAFRFNFGFIMSAALIPLLFIQPKILNISKPVLKTAICIIPFLFFCEFFIFGVLKHVKFIHNKDLPLYTLIYKPQTADYDKNSADDLSAKEVLINSQKVYFSGNCFDQCFPCSPYFREELEMRGNTYQDGFRIKQNK